FIYRMNISLPVRPVFPRKRGYIMKTRRFFLQSGQFIIVKQVIFRAATENQVDILKWYFMIMYMIHHSPERSEACAGTYQENIMVELWRKNKYALRATHIDLGTHFYLVKKISGACAAREQDND